MRPTRMTGFLAALCVTAAQGVAGAAGGAPATAGSGHRALLAQGPVQDVTGAVETGVEKTKRFFADRGASVTIGLGVDQFASSTALDYIGPGASYQLRLLVGTRTSVAFELAYFGAVSGISALGLDTGAVLVSNGVQGAVHYNFIENSAWQPYVGAGAAWRHYNVTRDAFNNSDVNGSDNVLEVPLMLGVGWRSESGLMVDARFAYRLAAGSDLLGGSEGGGPSLNNWNLGLQAGVEF